MVCLWLSKLSHTPGGAGHDYLPCHTYCTVISDSVFLFFGLMPLSANVNEYMFSLGCGRLLCRGATFPLFAMDGMIEALGTDHHTIALLYDLSNLYLQWLSIDKCMVNVIALVAFASTANPL